MTAIPFSPVATRFAWKEFRTLRGFWIAAFVLGALIQSLLYLIHDRPPGDGWPAAFLIVSLLTSALYVVGVAATTFAMEHEDETYSFLTGLPTRWRPIFAGKMWFALVSALALVVALAMTGTLMARGGLPSWNSIGVAFGAIGFVVVEALAWGIFFSLVLRQPLLAAILAIAAVSASLTLLTSTFVEGTLSSLSVESYVDVLPQRIALAVVVLLADVLLARRWITLDHGRRTAARPSSDLVESLDGRARALARIRSRLRPVAIRHEGLRMFARLAWQSWRQSWRWILGLPTIGLLLCWGMYLVTYAVRLHWLWPEDQIAIGPFCILLVVGGLYACGVFLADQRGRSYRFLAEHAAWPRSVWSSRQLVWILPIAITLSLVTAWAWMSSIETQRDLQRSFVNMWRASEWRGDFYIFNQWQEGGLFFRSFEFAVWGLALGFAIGQAASMFFRRALVAGLAVGLAALPCILFAILLWVWELSPGGFLLPMILGLGIATWLRTPDWLIERNTFRAWSKVGLALAIPVLLAAWRVPLARQLPPSADAIMFHRLADSLGVRWHGQKRAFPEALPINDIVTGWMEKAAMANSPTEQETFDRLMHLAESINGTWSWSPSFMGVQRAPKSIQQRLEGNSAIVDEATQLARKEYHFPPQLWDRDPSFVDPIRSRGWNLVTLLRDAAHQATQNNRLDLALDRLLAALTLQDRLNNGLDGGDEAHVGQQVVEWAAANGQTADRIRRAIAAVDEIYPEIDDDRVHERFTTNGLASMRSWSPPAFLMANFLVIRDIINGDEPSRLITPHAGWRQFAVIHLNSLPFERERALAILADILADQTAHWYRALLLTNQERLQQQARIAQAPRDDKAFDDTARQLRQLVRLLTEQQYLVDQPEYDTPPLSWMRTSPLLQHEYDRSFSRQNWLREFVDARVRAWGLRLQLALVAYRLDHREYPQSLDALVPDYLPFVPIDPYSGRPFEYRPHGLDHLLRGFRLSAGTPLFWSVGSTNSHPEPTTIIEPLDQQLDPSMEPMDVRHDVYEFRAVEGSIYFIDPLVFPLPK